MAAALTDQQLQEVQAQFAAHPEILQAFKTYQDWQQHRGRMAYVTTGGPPTPQQVLKKYGINFPDIEDYQIQPQPDGSVTLKRQNWFNRNADWILPVATIGGGAVANAVTGGGGAASGGGGATSGAPGPLSADETFTAGTVAPDAGTGYSATEAATTMGSTPPVPPTGFGAALKAALPTIIGAGASLGGAAIAAHGNTEAAKIAAASSDKALAQAKEIWQQQRADEAPYRNLGASALTPLSFGLGIPDPNIQVAKEAAANPPASTGVAAGAVDASGKPLPGAAQAPYIVPPTDAQQRSGSTLNTMGGVRVQNPQTGQIHLIPPDQVQAALADGGRVV